MQLRVVLALGILATVVAACGGVEETPTPTATNACGTVGALNAMECTGLATCGAGAQNFKKVAFCEHCLAGADSHVCEAGKCRAIATDMYGTLRAAFTLRQVGSSAQSVAQAAIYPVMADGTQITCAALMSGCGFVDNPVINANSNFAPIRQSGDVLFSPIVMEAGRARLYFAQFTTELQGRGMVTARGCVEGIDIVAGETTDIVVELSAP